MSSKYVQKYQGEDGKEAVQILEDGHINRNTLHMMRHKFGKPSDITNDLDKRNQDNPDANAPKNEGRTAYANIEAVYPDDEISSKMVINGCIIQYRESAFKDTGSVKTSAKDYGIRYVQIGIPRGVLDKIFSEATRHNVNMEQRKNTREKDGFYWVNCNIAKLETKNISLYVDIDGDTQQTNDTVRGFLNDAKSSLECTMTVTVSCTTTSSTRSDKIDLDRATYHPTIRPFEIIIEAESDVKGPELADISTQTKNETSEVTEKNIARGKLAQRMMERMKIG